MKLSELRFKLGMLQTHEFDDPDVYFENFEYPNYPNPVTSAELDEDGDVILNG